MDQNNEPKSPETANNFDDFNNMFKGIDRNDYTPDEIASIVLRKVELEHNPSRLDDAVEWFESCHFYKIRDWVDESAHEFRFENPTNNISPHFYDSDESEVGDIED